MADRFELEEQIMNCWHITDDLDVIAYKAMDEELSPDQIANLMLGLKELYSIRFNILFETFDQLIKEHKL